mgnify:CR=1 FL=1
MLTVFFNSNLGLLQGEITSSIMFSLYLNDIELHLQSNPNSGITVEQLSIYILLFADDAVIFSETAECLQPSLDKLQSYYLKWKLTVNILKTKIAVFTKVAVSHLIAGAQITIKQ